MGRNRKCEYGGEMRRQRSTFKATITKDAEKLWSCKKMQKDPRYDAIRAEKKLPKTSGEEVVLYNPASSSGFCNGKAWYVAKPAKSNADPYWDVKMICEHQIDFVKGENHGGSSTAAGADRTHLKYRATKPTGRNRSRRGS